MQHVTALDLAPLMIIALLLWALAKWAAPAWVLVLAFLLGIITSATILGPDISRVLSQLSGGRLG